MVEQVRRRRNAANDERLDRILHTLANTPRRRMVELLREAGELKVGDLAEAFSMSLNGVSKHVKVLEASGLVERRIDGREHWLRVDGEALRLPHEWIDYHHRFWSQRLDALADHMKRKGEKK